MVGWEERQLLNPGRRHRAVYSIIHGQKIGVFCLSFAWSGKGVTEAMRPDFFWGAAHGKLGSREEAKAPFV